MAIKIILSILMILFLIWEWRIPSLVKKKIGKRFKYEKSKKVFKSLIIILALMTILFKSVDIQSTLFLLIKKPMEEYLNNIIFYETNKLYQNGKVVGEIIKDISKDGSQITFPLIKDAKFNLNDNIDYRGNKLKCVGPENSMGVMSGCGFNCAENVRCQKLD